MPTVTAAEIAAAQAMLAAVKICEALAESGLTPIQIVHLLSTILVE